MIYILIQKYECSPISLTRFYKTFSSQACNLKQNSLRKIIDNNWYYIDPEVLFPANQVNVMLKYNFWILIGSTC